MSLAYNVWTEEEDKMRNLIPDGIYKSRIDSMEIKLSQGGKFDKDGKPIPQKKMLVLELTIFYEDKEKKLKNWVMLEGEMSWLFRHLCFSLNILDKYESNSVEPSDINGRFPIVHVKSKIMEDKDKNKVTRNYVYDYVGLNALPRPSSLQPLQSKNDFFNDDIPI